jgi:hypothetical protein
MQILGNLSNRFETRAQSNGLDACTLRLSPVHSLSLAPATSALASTLAPAAPVYRLQQATASGYSTRGPIRSHHSLSPLALAREDAIANASPHSRLPIAGR